MTPIKISLVTARVSFNVYRKYKRNNLTFHLLFFSSSGESIDKTGSYNEAIYTSMGMYAVCAVLCIAVPLYQKLFARHRFVMFDHQAKCRRLKTATAAPMTMTVAEEKTSPTA